MDIIEFIKKEQKYLDFKKVITCDSFKNIYIGNASLNLIKLLISASFSENPKNYIYVCENIFEASQAYERFCDMVGADFVSFFPVEEFISSELIASTKTFKLARMFTLNQIINNNPKIIVTTPEGLTRNVLSKEKISSSKLILRQGYIYSRDTFIKELSERGYKRRSIADEEGIFCVRGSIIDVYPINSSFPYRINYFDDEIESIKIINSETQRSGGNVDFVEIYPYYEVFYKNEEVDRIISDILKNHKLTDRVKKDIDNIKNYDSLDQLHIYMRYVDQDSMSFYDLVKAEYIYYEKPNNIFKHEKNAEEEIKEYFKTIEFKPKFVSLKAIDIVNQNDKNIFISENFASLNDIKIDKLINLNSIANFEYNNNFKILVEELKSNVERTYLLTAFDAKKLEFLKQLLESNSLEYFERKTLTKGKINLSVSTNAYGYIDLDQNFEIITPNEYASGKINKAKKYQKYYKNAEKIYTKDDLNIGDYIIHQDYGIGKYLGLEAKEIRGKIVDYLKIQYKDGSLYVPLESLYLLERYQTFSDSIVKLDTLDGKEWKKRKKKVQDKVSEMAKKLLEVQAARESKQGYIYSEDSKEQKEFENDFEYEETFDQKAAILEVKKDMESTHPVDRLICGDVGFGKTEVAMRAAFKAIDNGKQVAFLAPTTVLSRQHFYTLRDRFENYGIRVELLNRFVPASTQKAIIKGLKEGYVDIVVGTHRILSDDIVFKNLGMLIIDEEQRFGVAHKEKIKLIKEMVDVLTLSATPIPRTLQMSLSGIRDLSIISTPPSNRLPIQTYVLEVNDSVIREAINRELSRDGQVFYLANKIKDIEGLYKKIGILVPSAKLGVIHGKMDKEDIEETIENFLDKKINVLICTTIIETGIDIPNANTLIIEKADYLGLSQLYQIRGRIGRSDRISYAYLMYEKGKILTSDAKARLDAIKEFTNLGSGFKIASRDLAIRGAGDILGKEQSGFIESVGIELYMKFLNEAITELKNSDSFIEEERKYRIEIDKHIDLDYVPDDVIRVEMHREINKVRSREELNNLIDEFTDRYGVLSDDIRLYMEEKYLETLFKKCGVESFNQNKDFVEIIFDESHSSSFNRNEFFRIRYSFGPNYQEKIIKNKRHLVISSLIDGKSYVYSLTQFLEQVLNKC